MKAETPDTLKRGLQPLIQMSKNMRQPSRGRHGWQEREAAQFPTGHFKPTFTDDQSFTQASPIVKVEKRFYGQFNLGSRVRDESARIGFEPRVKALGAGNKARSNKERRLIDVMKGRCDSKIPKKCQ